MNIHHDNCCHPLDKLDKKSPVPVNHGRPSKSNVGEIQLKPIEASKWNSCLDILPRYFYCYRLGTVNLNTVNSKFL